MFPRRRHRTAGERHPSRVLLAESGGQGPAARLEALTLNIQETSVMKVIVIGGGWSGCAAAISAALLGTGLVGGIFRNNGRFTAAEEMIAMGGGEMFHAMDACTVHTNIEFPGHKHASLY